VISSSNNSILSPEAQFQYLQIKLPDLKKLTAPLAIALILFGLVFADIIRWMVISTSAAGFQEAQQEFYSLYPQWLRNNISTWLMILMLVTSAILFQRERRKTGRSIVLKTLFIISVILACWLLFTMM
jgi:hypothetical protein